MGGGVSMEAIYFLDGKNSGESEIFKTTRQNAGLNGSMGVYGIAANYHGDDSQLSFDDYKGQSFSVGAGIKGPWLSSGSMFWAPKNYENDKLGFKSLFNEDLRTWTGYTVGGGAGGGFQLSKQNTTLYE